MWLSSGSGRAAALTTHQVARVVVVEAGVAHGGGQLARFPGAARGEVDGENRAQTAQQQGAAPVGGDADARLLDLLVACVVKPSQHYPAC